MGHTVGELAYRRRYWLVIAGSLLCFLLVAILIDPLALVSDLSNAVRIRWELPRARERWESQGSATYRIHVKGAVPLVCFVDAELTVRDGSLAEVRARENPLVPDSPFLPVSQSDWDRQGCSYRDLTVEGMFQRVDTGLEEGDLVRAPLMVAFDEQRGFITEYRFGRASRGGLLGTTLSECCTWFEFDGFTEPPP
jgi:hypothetical protein